MSHAQQVTWYKQLHDLNKLNQNTPIPKAKTPNLRSTGQDKEALALTQVGYSLRKLKASYYSQGNRARKILAQRLRDRWTTSIIAHIQAPNGDRIVAPKAISDEFATHYESLYNLKYDLLTPSTFIEDYLSDAPLPTLSKVYRDALSAPITQQEVKDTIKTLPIGKAPGPD
ncbi:metabotropic glutamate receptor 2-like [Pelobates cultripes]|uniref:Metabotropic glutamate receptor 2-like n=1 Tax=Pelobates cultripes TaxID=61616 RepID=A0AAD1T5U8_PELCU|nr:metabotropic glutamate receptor 2-like [Pelobates cultripes]